MVLKLEYAPESPRLLVPTPRVSDSEVGLRIHIATTFLDDADTAGLRTTL